LVPNDPLYSSQWDLPKIGMPDAWAITTGSANVKVAVIDTGIDFSHEDLTGQWTYAPGRSPSEHVMLSTPVSSGCSVPSEPTDDEGHGTHVSGTIAAASTMTGGAAVGVAGIAPGVRIM